MNISLKRLINTADSMHNTQAAQGLPPDRYRGLKQDFDVHSVLRGIRQLFICVERPGNEGSRGASARENGRIRGEIRARKKAGGKRGQGGGAKRERTQFVKVQFIAM